MLVRDRIAVLIFGYLGASLVIIDRLFTAELPPSQRVPFWKDIFAAGDQSLSIGTQPAAFYGELIRLSVGELDITSVKLVLPRFPGHSVKSVLLNINTG